MPLTPPVNREHMHTRQIECRGFLRHDGLWDIEATLSDTKGYAFDSQWRGEISAGEPVHGMEMRLTVDDGYLIHEVEAVTDHSPFPVCPSITSNFQRLKGLRVTGGFSRKAREFVGGTKGCTHLLHLLQVMATVAFQTIRPRGKDGNRIERPPEGDSRSPIINSCHAWAEQGEAVRQWFPKFYTGPQQPGPTEAADAAKSAGQAGQTV